MLIAVNNLLPSYLITSPPNLEVVAIKLCFAGNHNISICTVYIPPNPNVAYFNLLVDFLNSFCQSEELFIIVGDLTCLAFVGPLSLVVLCYLTSFVTRLTYLSS